MSGLTLYVEHLAEGARDAGPRGARADATATRPSSRDESVENGVARRPRAGRRARRQGARRAGDRRASPAPSSRARTSSTSTPPRPTPFPVTFLAASLRVPIVITYHCDLQPAALQRQGLVDVLARASQNFALDRADRVVTYTEDYARHTPPLADRIEKVGWILPPVRRSAADRPQRRRGPRALRHPGPARDPLPRPLRRREGPAGPPRRAFAKLRRRLPEAVLLLAGARKVAGETVWERVAPLARRSGVGSPGARHRASGRDRRPLRGLRRPRPAVDQRDRVLRHGPGRGDALGCAGRRVGPAGRAPAGAPDRHGRDRAASATRTVSRARLLEVLEIARRATGRTPSPDPRDVSAGADARFVRGQLYRSVAGDAVA